IDVEVRPEFDPAGAFHLTVLYAPWPRTERGRRRQGEPLRFGLEAETVHVFETRSYEALVAELERWIARCTVWTREGDQEPPEGGACGERASSSRRAATAAPS